MEAWTCQGTIEGDWTNSNLDFSEEEGYLKVNPRLLSPANPPSASAQHRASASLTLADRFRIIRDWENLLWFPPDHRQGCGDISEEFLAFAYATG